MKSIASPRACEKSELEVLEQLDGRGSPRHARLSEEEDQRQHDADQDVARLEFERRAAERQHDRPVLDRKHSRSPVRD
jgi:hypothetical protein